MSLKRLAYILAQTLVEPVQKYSDLLYAEFIESVALLNEKYPIESEFKNELKKFAKEKYSSVVKHWQSGSFYTARFLSEYILKSFDTLGPDGGTYFEHPQIRKLIELYEDKLEVTYRYDYKSGKNFGKVLVVAKAKKGTKEKEVAFAFEYLKPVLIDAAWVLAYLRFKEKYKHELPEDNSTESSNASEKMELANESDSSLNKMRWRADRKHLEAIFRKMAKHTLPEYGRTLLVAKSAEIQKLIERNFEFSEANQKSDYPDIEHRLIYNGEIASFLRLLFYLTEKKVKGKTKPALSPPDSWIINFVCRNFMRYGKRGVLEDIPAKSVKDEWLRIRRKFRKNSDTLSDGNQSNSLLHILKVELSVFV